MIKLIKIMYKYFGDISKKATEKMFPSKENATDKNRI